jgi:phosphoribosylformylglycinamidine synthase subunit PurL
VYPTPTIGMLGLIENRDQMMTLDFKSEGDLIYLIGQSRNDLGSSEYLRAVAKVQYSPCPHFDLDEEFRLQESVKKAIQQGLLQSAHDISDGGLFAALLESAMPGGLGFSVQANSRIRLDAWLFGEAQSRVIVSIKTEQKAAFERFLQLEALSHEALGQVGGKSVHINKQDWGLLQSWQRTYNTVLTKIMG